MDHRSTGWAFLILFLSVRPVLADYCQQHPTAPQCTQVSGYCQANPTACQVTTQATTAPPLVPEPGSKGTGYDQGKGSNPTVPAHPGQVPGAKPDPTYQQDVDIVSGSCMQNKSACSAAMNRVFGSDPAGGTKFHTCANACGSPDPGAEQTCITGCMKQAGFKSAQGSGGDSQDGGYSQAVPALLVESMLRNNRFGNFSQACADAKAVLGFDPQHAQAAGIAKTACQWKPKPKSKPEPEKTAEQAPPAGPNNAASRDLSRAAVPAFGMGAAQPMQAPQWQKGTGVLNDRLLRLAQAKSDGNYARVLDEAGEALKLKPNDADLLDAKAFARNRTGDYKGALETADQAIAADPKNAAAYANRAYALGALGRRDDMIAALRMAASLDPGFEEALQKVLNSAGDAASLFDFPGEVRESKLQGSAKPSADGNTLEMIKWVVGAAVCLPLMGLILYFALRNTVMKTPPPQPATPWPKPTAAAPPARSDGPLQGKYELGRQIGAGGMGVVFEGRDLSLDRKVAVKKMLPQLAAVPRERQRFVSEAKIVAALHHPNIVDIHAIVEEGQDTYLIFEYVTGKTLHELISGRGRLPFQEAAKIIRDVSCALEFAHASGIVHRDLKPANVMIDDRGFVKVMDFGLARAAEDALSKLALTNTVVGTPAYMAPEQESGVVCKQSDVYSLGICLYEMLCGKRPFDGAAGAMMITKLSGTFPAVSVLAPGLPPGIDAFFSSVLAPDPAKRVPTVKDFVAALASLEGSGK